jgi:adenylate cyclase
MGEDEDATIRTLTSYRELMSTLIQKHRGRVVDSPGDNLLAEFLSVVDAVRCAVEIQEELRVRNAELPENRRMLFRIGVNIGDVIEDDDRIYGDGVNIAARVEGLAEAGGICISGRAYDHIENKLNLEYEYLGEKKVKNISRPVRVYRVRMETKAAVSEVSRTLELPDKPSIAVLPFVNMSGDPEQEYFSDGITEDIITDLSKISGLFVVARNASFTYKGTPVNPKQVERELRVRYVLEGSVRKAGSRVRISAQLIEAKTGHHLWAERFDRDLDDIFEVQDEITRQIVSALDVQLLHGEQAKDWRRTTENPEAYYLFLRAMEFMRGGYTRESCGMGKRLCERATTLDPEFSRAHVLMAGANLYEGRMGWSRSREESFERASALIEKALSLDDRLPGAHMARGAYHLFTMQHELALKEGETAIRLNPESSDAFAFLGLFQTFAGQPTDALGSLRKAKPLSPIWPPAFLLIEGQTYYCLARYEEAVSALRQSLEEADESLLAHVFLAATYEALGRSEEAGSEAQQVLRIEPKLALKEWAPRALPFKNAADLEHAVTLLRKAGLPG